MVLTEKDAIEIDRQWDVESKYNQIEREYFEVKEYYDSLQAAYVHNWGREPSHHDILWGVYNKQLMEHAQKLNWGLYRNTRFRMAQLLLQEGKHQAALETLIEVCYIDANGPRNLGVITDSALLIQFPPFDPKNTSQAPAVLSHIADLFDRLRLDEHRLRREFFSISSEVQKNLELPRSPEEAWQEVIHQLVLFGDTE
ncbi:MAG: hypothetical protein HYZ34_05130 [Ignavibacteriae bacterium]|nr:hypothetical protein [Ignavibacteriota bacterium]